jgi:hypothetical protein
MIHKLAFLILILFGLGACDNEKSDSQLIKQYACDETGVVRDYSGLDGCGYVIELNNGQILEPVFIDDTTFVFEDGKKISLSYYEETGLASICMAGKMVHITCISEINNKSLQDFGLFFNPENYPQDPFNVNSVKVIGDSIHLSVSYSGGCMYHEFTLGVVWPECGTPPVPPPLLYLCHNGNDDPCEAYPTETITFDLSLLKETNCNSSTFKLYQNLETPKYIGKYTYNYW